MHTNPRLAIILTLVFSLLQGCSSLGTSSSATAFSSKEAGSQIQKTQSRRPRTPAEEEAGYYQFLRGSVAESEGDLGTALQHYEKALALDPDSVAIRIAIANLQMDRGAFREAINTADEILAIDPGNVDVRLLLAAAYENIRNGRMAEQYYRDVLRLQPDLPEVYFRLGNLYTRMAKYPEAIEAYHEATAIAPDFYQARYNLARVYLEIQDVDKAIAELDAVLKLRPNFDQASLLLGLTYERLGRWEEAREVYRQAVQEARTHEGFRERIAETYLRAGDLAGALAELRAIAADRPGDVAVLNRIALLLLEMREHEEAQKTLEEVLALDADNREARFYLAISLEGQEKYTEALVELNKIEPRWEKYGDVVIHKGFVFGHLDRLDEALAAFEEAARLKPKDGNARYLLGVTHLRRKEYAQAVAAIEQAVGLNPDNVNYHYQLGAAYERNRQLDKAETAFRQTLAMDAKHADAYNYLGYMFAEEGVHLDESVALIKKALELEPDNGAFVDSLGWAYYKLGRLDEALLELQRAVTLVKKEDPTIREHLGDVYFDKGMIQQAVEQWQRSLELDDTNVKLKNKLQEARGLLLHGKQ